MTGFYSKCILATDRTFIIGTSLSNGRRNTEIRPKPRSCVIDF